MRQRRCWASPFLRGGFVVPILPFPVPDDPRAYGVFVYNMACLVVVVAKSKCGFAKGGSNMTDDTTSQRMSQKDLAGLLQDIGESATESRFDDTLEHCDELRHWIKENLACAPEPFRNALQSAIQAKDRQRVGS